MGAVSTTGAGVYSPSVVFGQQTASAAYAERMRIDSSGNVGIGTTTPAEPLDVAGNTRFSPPAGTTLSLLNGSTHERRHDDHGWIH
jgi:hypothetical protein